MRTNNVPSLVMLSAGLVDCIIGVKNQMDAIAFVKQLAIVLLVFYVIGSVLKLILDKAMKAFADPPEEKEKKKDQSTDEAEDASKVEEKK